MSQINISNLSFSYEGSAEPVFENVSFHLDTNWKLGLLGRNGKGKTTLLKLFLGKYSYTGSIQASVSFDYFPFELSERQRKKTADEILQELFPEHEFWKICREMDLLQMDVALLYRPFETLSGGEQARIMLAALFAQEGHFLLIDEPTSHLDTAAREAVRTYLQGKKGFILVSHDRQILDGCVDHILALERNRIVVEKGNFSSWWENKSRNDSYEREQNEKLKKEIGRLTEAAKRTTVWADRSEARKIGFDLDREQHRSFESRAYIGEKSRKMQQRRKNLERRQNSAIEDKEKLLKNIEEPVDLKLLPLKHHKEVYVRAEELCLGYNGKKIIGPLSFEIKRGERVVLQGKNGSGKSSIIKAILQKNSEALSASGRSLNKDKEGENTGIQILSGSLEAAAGLKISYISQDTSWMKGSLDDFAAKNSADPSLLRMILRQLDFPREQFAAPIETYSEGQKKKLLTAGSLLCQAHLYIWDEPLNYIDVFSRIQIENLILKYQPAMLLAEHDETFIKRCSVRRICL